MLRPRQHRLKFTDFRYLQVSAHYHLNHALAELEEVLRLKQGEAPGFDEGEYHVDQLGGRRVPPIVILKRHQHGTNNVDPEKLFGMMEARLQQLRQVIVLSRTDKPWNRLASKRAASGVKII